MARTALAAGSVIDGFRLEEVAYRGGMATLWRVTHADMATPLVMKVPRLEYGEDAAAIVGFEVEQMIMPSLSGTHVPRFIAAGDFTALPYLVMEFIDGPSLRARLEQAPLPPEEVAALGAKVATALHQLHRQNVIHLDLKPSSVLFRANGDAVLIDYGLAHHNQLPDLLAEQFRLPLGTGPYMSPEQIYGVRNDARSDLFALGVTLYFLATGERPFGNPTSIGGLRQRLYQNPPPPAALRPGFPPWLQEIILHCLEIDPARRYNTAAQVAFDLQHPQQVVLGERAARTARDDVATRLRRWLGSFGAGRVVHSSIADHLASAPIVMVAVDLMPGMEALGAALQRATRRVLAADAGARLSCVTVLKTSRIALDSNVDAEGRNLHVQRLVELKHWARTLGLDAARVTFHVLEAPDPASALVEYAHNNHVDHIVVGARASSAVRRFLGSVSSRIVAEAPCTVSVVRVPHNERDVE
jgi:nucleotide-binding universal stress UspA family protein